MRNEIICLALGALIATAVWATAAFPCGDGSCEPPPPPPPPPVVYEPPPQDDDRDPELPISKPLPCCIRDGVVEFKAPWPSERSKAKTRLTCQIAAMQDVKFRKCTSPKKPKP